MGGLCLCRAKGNPEAGEERAAEGGAPCRVHRDRHIVKTLENRYPIFKAGEAAGTSMCRVLSMKSTVRPFHGPWGAYAPQG